MIKEVVRHFEGYLRIGVILYIHESYNNYWATLMYFEGVVMVGKGDMLEGEFDAFWLEIYRFHDAAKDAVWLFGIRA